ncbi:MAG: 5'-methylthioadenosine/adenosylhomocysteine nucleosidase [Clostridia bacterium]|nr:5'-methylthioadenosine/adenosylhomocysteine nucleosidase [Clostridia bacterium]
MIAIIVAMPQELEPYKPHLKKAQRHFGKDFYEGVIGDVDVVICLSGIGKVNAAFAATLLIQLYKPDFLISTGLSGGLGKTRQSDIVLADKIVQHDVDTTALGDPKGMVSTVNKIFFETDGMLLERFVPFLPHAISGTIASGDQFVADKALSAQIADQFGAIACDMESGAVAQIAFITGTPLAVIRGISDAADGEAAADFNTVIKKISVETYKAVANVIEKL